MSTYFGKSHAVISPEQQAKFKEIISYIKERKLPLAQVSREAGYSSNLLTNWTCGWGGKPSPRSFAKLELWYKRHKQ